MALPNNKMYGYEIELSGENLQFQFITDQCYNYQIIEISKNVNNKYKGFKTSCYYDGSIFTFEVILNNYVHNSCFFEAASKSYSISQGKWTCLPKISFAFPISCIGFKQKILITDESCKQYILVYDINLNSYSESTLAGKIMKNGTKTFTKSEGKLYLIIFSVVYETDDPFAEWHLVSNLDRKLDIKFSYKVLYEGSIYYLRNNSLLLHEFNFQILNKMQFKV